MGVFGLSIKGTETAAGKLRYCTFQLYLAPKRAELEGAAMGDGGARGGGGGTRLALKRGSNDVKRHVGYLSTVLPSCTGVVSWVITNPFILLVTC